MSSPTEAPRTHSLQHFTLRVLEGPAPAATKRFEQARCLLGASARADFSLADPTVSEAHAEILIDPSGGFRVRDLGSKHGVRLGSHRVREATLNAEDVLTLGTSVLGFAAGASGRALPALAGLGRLVGSAAAMQMLYAQIAEAAATEAPVLLVGEPGTGKALVAEELIARGRRATGPFVAVDCAALSDSLVDAELYGHERGAFTGAGKASPGAFERAERGTLFLDQVSELSAAAQAKLLEVLTRKEVRRLGASRPVPVDVRVLATSRRALEPEVNRGSFRADLYFRLAEHHLRVPSLAERREDIPALIAHGLEALAETAPISPRSLRELCLREYPGNLRELQRALERAAAGFPLELEGSAASSRPAFELDLAEPYRRLEDRMLADLERDYLTALLAGTRGNLAEAARRSGLERAHLYTRWRRYGLL